MWDPKLMFADRTPPAPRVTPRLVADRPVVHARERRRLFGPWLPTGWSFRRNGVTVLSQTGLWNLHRWREQARLSQAV